MTPDVPDNVRYIVACAHCHQRMSKRKYLQHVEQLQETKANHPANQKIRRPKPS